MLASVREAVSGKLPTVAERGGFPCLGQARGDERGQAFPMAGVLPGQGVQTPRLVRFGYGTLRAGTDSLLFRQGEAMPVHEFHYWDSTENGRDLRVEKPLSGRGWDCGFVSESLYAAFPHLYFAGTPQLAERFVTAARRYREREG